MSRLKLRLATWLASHSGSATRAAELQDHLAEAAGHGARVGWADVVSIGVLAVRAGGSRAKTDVRWWGAGLPIALWLVLPVLWVYSNHFLAWDMVDGGPTTVEARRWQMVVNGLAILAAVSAIGAGRRVIRRLAEGRVAGPALLVLAIVAALTQADLFIEHTAPFRDGQLWAAHVNEVSMYSVGLFAAVALIPVAYLGLDSLLSGRCRLAQPERAVQIDGRALAAVLLPLSLPVAGWVWTVPFLGVVWTAAPFSRALKFAATAVTVGPAMGLAAWAAFAGPPDDAAGALVAIAVVFVAVWVRLAQRAVSSVRIEPTEAASVGQ